MSCTLHDVHDPQSASASMTASQRSAISCRRSIGAGLVNVGLQKRTTSAPRSRSRASMRSRKTSPRGLEMSSSAMRAPASERRRGARARAAGVAFAGRIEQHEGSFLVHIHGAISRMTG